VVELSLENFRIKEGKSMTDNNSTKNKHMTFDDRLEIQNCLDHGMTFKAIAGRIHKDQTTVSKEVKRHLNVRPHTSKRLDDAGLPTAAPPCPHLLKAPFVCNPCEKRHKACPFQKQYYFAKKADADYKALLKESREGIPLNKESFYEIDKVISTGVKNGQHIYHIAE
jgi:hypothetical protein